MKIYWQMNKQEIEFGIVFTVLLLAIGYFFPSIRVGLFSVAGLLLITTVFLPGMLYIPSRLWLMLAGLLSKFVAPILISVIFLTVVIPTGFAMRLIGIDNLGLAKRQKCSSYWIRRKEAPGLFKDMF